MTTGLQPLTGRPGDTPPVSAQASARRPWSRPGTHALDYVVPAAAVLTVLLRLTMVARPPSPDEAGFLTVARQWYAGGSSLYGSYWVDRPPLLITIFRAAALTGGLVPLRLIGCLAAALTVLGVAQVAARAAGHEGGSARVAGAAAAVVAAGWCVSPMAGSPPVNGELLAAPFVAWGVVAATAAARSAARGAPRGRAQAAMCGLMAVAAVLVKQNVADVWVFAAALVVIQVMRRELSAPAAGRLAAWFAAGAGTCAAVVGAWTWSHGTSLGGVLYAMYPFRLAAAHVIATSGSAAASVRLEQLLLAWAFNGMALLIAVVAVQVLTVRRARTPAALALLALVAFDLLSIVLGGGYWLHYLVQLIVPLAALTGIAVARHLPGARLATGVAVIASVAALAVSGVLLPGQRVTEASSLGHAVAAVARPGDTVVSLYGHSDVVQQSGLASPYRYLWALPVKVLDPHLRELDRVLTGPGAPTWVVTWAHTGSSGVQGGPTSQILARDYRVAAVLHGHTVYLHNGVQRSEPTWPPAPSGTRTTRAVSGTAAGATWVPLVKTKVR